MIQSTSHEDIAVVEISPATGKYYNIFDLNTLRELSQILEEIQQDKPKGLLLHYPRVVGSNIYEIQALKDKQEAQEFSLAYSKLYEQVAKLAFPSVSTIHGHCLGSGLELALACKWRIASIDTQTKLGFPDIKLGLIPGWVACQMLPKMIGIEAALDLIMEGKTIDSAAALAAGVINFQVPKQTLRENALELLKHRTINSQKPAVAANRSRLQQQWWQKILFTRFKFEVDSKTLGLNPAAYKALEACFNGFNLESTERFNFDAKIFAEAVLTRPSQAYIHLYRAALESRRRLKQLPSPKSDKLIGLIGAGNVGLAIHRHCIQNNFKVWLNDTNPKSIGQALSDSHQYFRGFPKPAFLLTTPVELDDLSVCDIVIDASLQDLEAKSKILNNLAEKDCLCISTTPTLSLSELAKTMPPEQVIGMNFNPLSTDLIEIITTVQTSETTLARTLHFCERLGQKTIVVNDKPGFFSSRVLSSYLHEALLLVSEGYEVAQIDNALSQLGFKHGPLWQLDQIGLDVFKQTLEFLHKTYPNYLTVPTVLEQMCKRKEFGKKSQLGFYYHNEEEKPRDLHSLEIEPNDHNHNEIEDEITERCLMIFVNESLRCLEEKVLQTPHDGDLGAVYGMGFPKSWGGPFKYVDFTGAHHVLAILESLESRDGLRFTPTDLLRQYTQEGKHFFQGEPWRYVLH